MLADPDGTNSAQSHVATFYQIGWTSCLTTVNHETEYQEAVAFLLLWKLTEDATLTSKPRSTLFQAHKSSVADNQDDRGSQSQATYLLQRSAALCVCPQNWVLGRPTGLVSPTDPRAPASRTQECAENNTATPLYSPFAGMVLTLFNSQPVGCTRPAAKIEQFQDAYLQGRQRRDVPDDLTG